MAQPPRGGVVQARVLDRYRRLRREELRQFHVLVGERAAPLLLGEIQVPVRNTPEQDRNAEKAPHRWVVGREPDRARVVAEVLESQRVRLAYQDAENPPSSRQIADRRV